MAHKRKHIAAFILFITVLCLALLLVSHQRQGQAEQQQRAIDKTYQLFDAVKGAYLGQEYSATYRVRQPQGNVIEGGDGLISVRRPDEELIPALEIALQALAKVNPDNLLGCDRRLFFSMEPELSRRVGVFRKRVERQSDKRTRAARQLFDEARRIDSAKDTDVRTLKFQKPLSRREQALSAITETLTGAPLSPNQLLEIAQAELDVLQQDLQRLEVSLIRLNLAESLDEYAARDEFFAVNSDEILEQYKALRPILRQSFLDRFYSYDVAEVETLIKTQSHRMMARGAYDPRRSRVYLYHDRDVFDLKGLGFLAVHEYFPGHHFEHQIKPAVGLCPHETARPFSVEAWSTYAEYLADEVGFFDDPARRLGWLDYRLIRVGRIFIDVRELEEGLSKEELRQVWNNVLPRRLHDVFDQEYERVFSPKSHFRRLRYQHLHYLLGYQTIQATKIRLQDVLGDDFDERKFHHILLTGANSDVGVMYESVKAGMEVEGGYPFYHEPMSPLVSN